MKQFRWTKEQERLLKAIYNNMSNEQIASLFNKVWEKEGGWTANQVLKKLSNRKWKRINPKRFYKFKANVKNEVIPIKKKNTIPNHVRAKVCEMANSGMFTLCEIEEGTGVHFSHASTIIKECLGLGRKDNPVIITKESKV